MYRVCSVVVTAKVEVFFEVEEDEEEGEVYFACFFLRRETVGRISIICEGTRI